MEPEKMKQRSEVIKSSREALIKSRVISDRNSKSQQIESSQFSNSNEDPDKKSCSAESMPADSKVSEVPVTNFNKNDPV